MRRNPGIPSSTLIGALGFLLSAVSANAQQWIPVGPPGGDVRSLAVDPLHPKRVYLGTAEGVLYRSDVGGLAWQVLRPGFPIRGQSLDEIVVSPAGTVLVGFWDVGGQGGGVALSTDGGRTFTFASGLEGESVRALAVAPSDPRRLAAGTMSGVFASRDGGSTWRRISPRGHPELRNVQSVTIGPHDPQVVYVGTRHLPWRSMNGGSTWKPLHAGMTDDSDVFTISLDHRDGRRLFATTCSGIYRATEGSPRWARVLGIPWRNRRTRAFAQDRVHSGTFYAGTTEGLWISQDDTLTWRAATEASVVVNALATLSDGTLLVGSEGGGILRSTDRGRSWISSNTGFSERLLSRIVFDGSGRRVLVGVRGDRPHGGVLTAATPRGPWIRLGTGLEGREILSLSTTRGAVLAGTDDGLFSLSRAAEVMWRRLPLDSRGRSEPMPIGDVAALSTGVILVGTPSGLLRGTDTTNDWQRPLPESVGSVHALAVSADDSGAVLAATASGLWMSTNAGLTWRSLPTPKRARVNAVAFLPGEVPGIFAAAKDGLYRSADLGRTWKHGGWGLPHSDMTSVVVHPDGRTLYLTDFQWGGVYRSVDRGDTWSRLTDTGLLSDRAWTLAIDPARPNEPLAAPIAGGLHLFDPLPLRLQPIPASTMLGHD